MAVRAQGRQFRTYYEGLAAFDDRLIQDRLRLPGLNWAGGEDVVVFGELAARIGPVIVDNRDALESAGWEVRILPEADHASALAPDVWTPMVRGWLDESWPRLTFASADARARLTSVAEPCAPPARYRSGPSG